MDVDVSVVDKISAEICQSHYGKARDMIRQAYKKYGTIFVTTFLEYMDINHIGNHSSYLNELIKLVHPKTLKYGSSLEQFVYIMYFATPDDFIDVRLFEKTKKQRKTTLMKLKHRNPQAYKYVKKIYYSNVCDQV